MKSVRPHLPRPSLPHRAPALPLLAAATGDPRLQGWAPEAGGDAEAAAGAEGPARVVAQAVAQAVGEAVAREAQQEVGEGALERPLHAAAGGVASGPRVVAGGAGRGRGEEGLAEAEGGEALRGVAHVERGSGGRALAGQSDELDGFRRAWHRNDCAVKASSGEGRGGADSGGRQRRECGWVGGCVCVWGGG